MVDTDCLFEQFATVCRQPICKRWAIQSNVITVSILKCATISTFAEWDNPKADKMSALQKNPHKGTPTARHRTTGQRL